ncbi:hypothetical protein AB0H51_28225 [Streptomyces griseoluteus]|uniref:hypothetical protein n=1 Tax=Streptomyces griseoluteus TaxID=29306 RepID=UPI0033E55A6E
MSGERLERLESGTTETAELAVIDAELVDDDREAAPVRYVVTQHTMLAPGELPPRADERPAWGEHEFRLTPEDVADLDEPDLADNTITNRDSTVRAFKAWCAQQKPPHLPQPCTTLTYTRYGLHLIRLGKAGKYKPDTVGAYMSRILNWQPVDMRPDPSRFKGRLRAWRREWVAAGGEVRRAPAVTINYNLRIIEAIDETTNIGKRDAFLAALAYCNLHREMELADQLVKRVKVHDTGLFVTTAMSKTDQTGKGTGRFIQDRADLQLVRRARAWLAVLHELGADGPDDPLFRSLTKKGKLRKYPEARERGQRMRPGSLNERLQVLADRAGVPYIDGKKVTSHSWRAGANTDMIAAGVSLKDRNTVGRWADGSKTADTVYDRPNDTGESDPLARVPLYGGPAHAAVAEARAGVTD